MTVPRVRPMSSDDPGSTDPTRDQHVEVDLAAFLPEGTSLGDSTPGDGTDLTSPDAATEPDPGPAVDLAALVPVEHDLDAVEAAIAALDAGTYGTCQVCGDAMPTADLADEPVRRACARHVA